MKGGSSGCPDANCLSLFFIPSTVSSMGNGGFDRSLILLDFVERYHIQLSLCESVHIVFSSSSLVSISLVWLSMDVVDSRRLNWYGSHNLHHQEPSNASKDFVNPWNCCSLIFSNRAVVQIEFGGKCEGQVGRRQLRIVCDSCPQRQIERVYTWRKVLKT
jgi:hypothetical protein